MSIEQLLMKDGSKYAIYRDNPSAIDSVSIEPLSVLHSKFKFEW